MEKIGYHTPATIRLDNKPPCTQLHKTILASDFAGEKNLLPLHGIKPRFLGCPIRNLVTTQTTFYRLHTDPDYRHKCLER